MDPEMRPNPWQCAGPGAAGGGSCPGRDLELQFFDFWMIFHCFWLSFGPLRRQNTLQIVKDIIIFSLSHSPSQYRMTSIYGLT